MLAGGDRPAQPPRGQRPEQVTVGEYRHLARVCASPGDHAVGAAAHVLRTLPARRTVREDEPPRRALVDLGRRQALVLTVVPFDEVGVHLA